MTDIDPNRWKYFFCSQTGGLYIAEVIVPHSRNCGGVHEFVRDNEEKKEDEDEEGGEEE